MIQFDTLPSLPKTTISTSPHASREGCFEIGGQKLHVQTEPQTILSAKACALPFYAGVGAAFDGKRQESQPAAGGQTTPTPNLKQFGFSLLRTDNQDFIASTKRSFASLKLDRPSKPLREVRQAFRQAVAHPADEQVNRLEQTLAQWQLKRPSEFAHRGQKTATLRKEMTQLVSHLQTQRAKTAGVLGLAMPLSITNTFAHQVMFDGIGRITGLKNELMPADIELLKQQQITPLTRVNATVPRETPRTEAESLIAFTSALRKAATPEALALAEQAKTMWLRGNVNTQTSIALYRAAVSQLRDQPMLRHMAASLLADAHKEKSPGQYIDNLFGRYFDSEFAHELVQHPSAQAKTTSAQIGQFLVKEFDQWLSTHANPVDPVQRDKRLENFANIIGDDIRPWFSEVPELTAFLAKPDYDHFKTMMSKVDNGFDVIKIPFLAVKMALTEGMGQNMSPWKRQADSFYRSTIVKARSTTNVINAGTDTSYYVQLKKQQTQGYGTMLPHQPVGTRYENFQKGRHVTAGLILTPGNETLFEKNALAQGLTVVSGTSGSTNIMTFLNNHIADPHTAGHLPDFSPQQAYLNTLAFLVFDGGHSVNESLAVYQALQAKESSQRTQILHNYTANYEDLVNLMPASERATVLQALHHAFDKTIALQQQLRQPPSAPANHKMQAAQGA